MAPETNLAFNVLQRALGVMLRQYHNALMHQIIVLVDIQSKQLIESIKVLHL